MHARRERERERERAVISGARPPSLLISFVVSLVCWADGMQRDLGTHTHTRERTWLEWPKLFRRLLSSLFFFRHNQLPIAGLASCWWKLFSYTRLEAADPPPLLRYFGASVWTDAYDDFIYIAFLLLFPQRLFYRRLDIGPKLVKLHPAVYVPYVCWALLLDGVASICRLPRATQSSAPYYLDLCRRRT